MTDQKKIDRYMIREREREELGGYQFIRVVDYLNERLRLLMNNGKREKRERSVHKRDGYLSEQDLHR